MNFARASLIWNLDLSQSKKLLLLRLDFRSDNDQECWPSIASLAKDLKCSKRTVQRLLKELQEEGYIVASPYFEPNGRQSSNIFRLTLAEESASVASPAHSERSTDCHPQSVTAVMGSMSKLRRGGGDKTLSALEPPTELSKELLQQRQARFPDLRMPQFDTDGERSAVLRFLQGVPQEHAQILLDELDSVVRQGKIRTTVAQWFRAVVDQYWNGRFVPSAGVDARSARTKLEASESARAAKREAKQRQRDAASSAESERAYLEAKKSVGAL